MGDIRLSPDSSVLPRPEPPVLLWSLPPGNKWMEKAGNSVKRRQFLKSNVLFHDSQHVETLSRWSFTLLKHFSSSCCILRASSSSCKTCCSSPRSSLASPTSSVSESSKGQMMFGKLSQVERNDEKEKTSEELKCYELEAKRQEKAADDVWERLIFLIKWSRWE